MAQRTDHSLHHLICFFRCCCLFFLWKAPGAHIYNFYMHQQRIDLWAHGLNQKANWWRRNLEGPGRMTRGISNLLYTWAGQMSVEEKDHGVRHCFFSQIIHILISFLLFISLYISVKATWMWIYVLHHMHLDPLHLCSQIHSDWHMGPTLDPHAYHIGVKEKLKHDNNLSMQFKYIIKHESWTFWEGSDRRLTQLLTSLYLLSINPCCESCLFLK
jgi:hypothetical protein